MTLSSPFFSFLLHFVFYRNSYALLANFICSVKKKKKKNTDLAYVHGLCGHSEVESSKEFYVLVSKTASVMFLILFCVYDRKQVFYRIPSCRSQLPDVGNVSNV